MSANPARPLAAAKDSELPVAFTHIALLIRSLFNQQTKRFGLTATQWELISVLSREGGLTQTELAQRVTRSKSSIGKSLDAMERDGWITRVSDPRDRRIRRVERTDKIKGFGDELRQPVREINHIIGQQLSSSEIQTLRQMLQKVLESLEQAERSAP